VLCVLAGAAPAGAEPPPGPRLLISKGTLGGRFELFTVDGSGGTRETLAKASGKDASVFAPYMPPAWSPDGSQVAVTLHYRASSPNARRLPFKLALVSAEGGDPVPLRGTNGGFGPVFSPDGGTIAFARERRRSKRRRNGEWRQVYGSTSIWMLDLTTGNATRLTPWRNRLHQTPSSFSPDGSRLAFTRVVGSKPPEAIAMAFDGTAATVLAKDALEPVYSPDGKSLAFLRGPVRTRVKKTRSKDEPTETTTTVRMTDVYVKSVGGGGLRRLTRTRNALELSPRWDPSGQRLAYTKVMPFRSDLVVLGFGDAVMEINADGTCTTKLLSARRPAQFSGGWQPGPGREAGPIAC